MNNTGDREYLSYVFDISDTYDKFGRNVYIWEVNHSFDKEIIEDIDNRYDNNLELKDTLPEAIISSSYLAVQDNLQDYLSQINEIKDDTILGKLNIEAIEYIIQDIISKSVAFIELRKCGYNPLNYFNEIDFSNIRLIKQIDIVSILGTAIADISKSQLQEIYKTNYKLKEEKISTFENIKTNIYNKEKREEIVENGNDNISSRRRNIDTKHSNKEYQNNKSREIWTDEIELSKREQESNLHSNEDKRNITRSSIGDRQERERDGTTDSKTNSTNRENRREIETERPNEMGTINERNEKSSTGDNNERDNLQLNLFTNNIENTPKQAEVENTPAFSLSENINKNYKLRNGNYFHLHTNEEGYYYEIYDQFGFEKDGGLLEYSDNEENETLISVRKRLAEFTDIQELSDSNLKEISQEDIDYITSGQKVEDVGNEIKEKAIEQVKNVVNLFKDREENGKPLNRDEDYKKQEKINYHIDNDDLGEGSPKEKYQMNVNAIKTLKKIEQEDRFAIKEEQEILSKYVGWGGLADAFDENKDNWRKEYLELKSLLDENEYSKARESTLTSFYTPPIVIKSIYQAIRNMGFKNGNILEPSCRNRKFFRTKTTRIRKFKSIWCRIR